MAPTDPKILSCKEKDGFWQKSFFYLTLLSVLLIFFFHMVKGLTPFCFPYEGVYVVSDAYFLSQNVSWFPFPHLKLPCDFFAYPYKFDPIFLTWMLEHDYFSGLLMAIFGIGPWEQIYWMISLVLSTIIPYELLRKYGDYKSWQAALFVFLATFCNYAVICKYPGHYTLVIYHWVLVSFVMDFLILKRYFEKEKYTAAFVLLKMIFLVLCLGLELGYIAGMAFCSSFIVCIYIFLCELIRSKSLIQPFRWFWIQFLYVCRDFRTSWINYFLLGVLFLVLYLYLPIVLQIAFITKTSGVSGSDLMQTASLHRMLLPIFPWCHPAMYVKHCLVDPVYGVADTIYGNCVGWSFLLILFGGILFSKKNFRVYFPFVLLVFLIVFVVQVPLLKYFPCFSYARFSERFSPALVPLISLAILSVDRNLFSKSLFKIFICILIPLFSLECFTAYSKSFAWIDLWPLQNISPESKRIIKKLQDWSGQAICFLPFSVRGGDENFIGARGEDLSDAHEMQFAAFAKKKTNNFYGGRLDLNSGELPLMQKCHWEVFHNQLKRGALSRENLQQFKKFVKSADFSALVLFDIFLSPEAKKQMFEEFGPSEMVSVSGYLFHVIFLPDSYRQIQKPQKDVYFCWDYPVEIDHVTNVKGFSGSWAVEKEAHIALPLKCPQKDLLLSFEGFPFLHQKFQRYTMSILMNGKQIGVTEFKLNQSWKNSFIIPKDLIIKGDNDLAFIFSDLRSPAEFGIADERKLGFHFSKLVLKELSPNLDITMTRYSHLSGFHAGEPSGRWSGETRARVHLFLAKPDHDLTFSFEGFPYLNEKFTRNEMSVFWNGKKIETVIFQMGKKWNNKIRIPKDLILQGENTVEFQFKDLKAPAEFGFPDARKLGFHFVKIKTAELMPVE